MKRWIVPIIAVVVLAVLIGWRIAGYRQGLAQQQTQRIAMRSRPMTVAAATVGYHDMSQGISAAANITSPLTVHVASRVAARILQVTVHEGDPVRVGQVLIRLDPSDLQAQLLQSEAALAGARSRFTQAQIGQAPTTTAVNTQIVEARAALQSAQHRLKQAKYGASPTSSQVQTAIAQAQADVEAAQAGYQQAVASANDEIASAQQSANEAKATWQNARAFADREGQLAGKGYIAQQDVDTARTQESVSHSQYLGAMQQISLVQAKVAADTKVAKAKVDQAKAALSYAKANTAQNLMSDQNIQALQQAVDQARASLQAAEAQRAQVPEYRQNLAALQQAVDQAQAQAQFARVQLSYTVIRSPVDGFVLTRNSDPGAMAPASSLAANPLLTLVAIRTVWVEIPIPEYQSAQVRYGQLARVSVDALPGRTFTGRVIQITPGANPQSRDFTVRVELPNPNYLLKPGLFAHVYILTHSRPHVLSVAREAEQTDPSGQTFAWLVQNHVVHKQRVEFGMVGDRYVEVKSGLQPGRQVVVLSQPGLREGTKVRIGKEGAKYA